MKLRVCLTEKCNFLCDYCRPGGEGGQCTGEVLSADDIGKIVNILSVKGFKAVRLTGGEPLLRKEFFSVVDAIEANNGINKLTMVTNGSMLNARIVEQLKKRKLKSVTVSLDSVNDEVFNKMTGTNCLERVIKGIDLLLEQNIKVKINSVMTKSSIDGLDELITFCEKREIPLKLLDLVGFGTKHWDEEFISLGVIRNKFDNVYEKRIGYQDEGFGTPEEIYKVGSIEITIKDSTLGTCYSGICHECDHYPCQTGVVSFIMTHDGFLKFCPISDKYNIDLKPLLQQDENALRNVENLIGKYNESKFDDSWYLGIRQKELNNGL